MQVFACECRCGYLTATLEISGETAEVAFGAIIETFGSPQKCAQRMRWFETLQIRQPALEGPG